MNTAVSSTAFFASMTRFSNFPVTMRKLLMKMRSELSRTATEKKMSDEISFISTWMDVSNIDIYASTGILDAQIASLILECNAVITTYVMPLLNSFIRAPTKENLRAHLTSLSNSTQQVDYNDFLNISDYWYKILGGKNRQGIVLKGKFPQLIVDKFSNKYLTLVTEMKSLIGMGYNSLERNLAPNATLNSSADSFIDHDFSNLVSENSDFGFEFTDTDMDDVDELETYSEDLTSSFMPECHADTAEAVLVKKDKVKDGHFLFTFIIMTEAIATAEKYLVFAPGIQFKSFGALGYSATVRYAQELLDNASTAFDPTIGIATYMTGNDTASIFLNGTDHPTTNKVLLFERDERLAQPLTVGKPNVGTIGVTSIGRVLRFAIPYLTSAGNTTARIIQLDLKMNFVPAIRGTMLDNEGNNVTTEVSLRDYLGKLTFETGIRLTKDFSAIAGLLQSYDDYLSENARDNVRIDEVFNTYLTRYIDSVKLVKSIDSVVKSTLMITNAYYSPLMWLTSPIYINHHDPTVNTGTQKLSESLLRKAYVHLCVIWRRRLQAMSIDNGFLAWFLDIQMV